MATFVGVGVGRPELHVYFSQVAACNTLFSIMSTIQILSIFAQYTIGEHSTRTETGQTRGELVKGIMGGLVLIITNLK